MCLLDNSLHFTVEIKAVLEGRGFRPTIFGNLYSYGLTKNKKPENKKRPYF